MSILIKFLFFFNIFNIFSTEFCELTLYFKLQDYKKNIKCSFKIPRKKYTFEEFKKELDNQFNLNKETKEDCKKIIEKSKKNNYSELLKDYKLLSFNDDYNIDNFTEIDLTDKEEFYLEYSFKIDKKYDFEFYNIEIKEDFKKELAEKLKIKEEEISKEFEEEVKKLNDFLNKKKLFITIEDIDLICDFLKFKIMNFDDYNKTIKLYINYSEKYDENSIDLFDVKKGFSFNCDYFKPIKATIIRRNYETKQQYGQIIKKDICIKSINFLKCSYSILEIIFPKSNPNNLIIYKINEYQISDIKNKTSYDNDLKKLENILRTNEITIDLLTEVDTPEEDKKKQEEKEEKDKKEKEEQENKIKEQQKNKCCCC